MCYSRTTSRGATNSTCGLAWGPVEAAPHPSFPPHALTNPYNCIYVQCCLNGAICAVLLALRQPIFEMLFRFCRHPGAFASKPNQGQSRPIKPGKGSAEKKSRKPPPNEYGRNGRIWSPIFPLLLWRRGRPHSEQAQNRLRAI